MSTSGRNSALVIPPSADKHSGTVIFLHGLGDTGFGWEDAMLIVQKELPSVKFVLPRTNLVSYWRTPNLTLCFQMHHRDQ